MSKMFSRPEGEQEFTQFIEIEHDGMTREELCKHAHGAEEKPRWDILYDSISMQSKKRHS